MRTGAILLIVFFALLLGLSIWWMSTLWSGMPEFEMGTSGWVAMIGGGVLTLIVGGGLMSLAFFSARHGYDDLDRD